jgi:hypothetical protein
MTADLLQKTRSWMPLIQITLPQTPVVRPQPPAEHVVDDCNMSKTRGMQGHVAAAALRCSAAAAAAAQCVTLPSCPGASAGSFTAAASLVMSDSFLDRQQLAAC